ncbi:hypothetical protein ACFE04_025212 [Oxalis oulophora]
MDLNSILRWRAPVSPTTRRLTIILVTLATIFFIIFRHKNNLLLLQASNDSSSPCTFPAIFNFGDSNSDTGGKSAAFHRLPSPNGDTFFHKPSGRYSDGKVVIDFIAERFGLPFLSAYLDSIGTNFRHGANFATGGSTIQPADATIFGAGFSPISLDLQLKQFEQFKARSLELYNQGPSLYPKTSLPKPEDFGKALYTFDIGQNDLHAGFKLMTNKQVVESIPGIINMLSQAVEQLYENGARAFWIHNTGPIGCLPFSLIYSPPKPVDMDVSGCINSENEIAQEFNEKLKEKISQLRTKLLDAVFTYIDIYTAKYLLISEAKNYGFSNPLGYCCGHYGDYYVACGKKVIVNGTEIFGASCSDPSSCISWDGVHYTHAANEWVASKILDGSLADPSTTIAEACGKSVHL